MTKILIEESVLRQALVALSNARQRIQYMLNNGEWYSPEQVVDQADKSITALRTEIDSAEKVKAPASTTMPEFTVIEKERDELVEALTEIIERIEDHPAYAKLTMDEENEIGGDTAEFSYLARVGRDVLAKLGADKTGEK